MVNYEWYRTFKAIYDYDTLTAAAAKLYISQPGVSLHLSSLEAYVGSKLFDRVSKRMIPTERGKQLYNAIVEPMLQLEEVESRFQRTTEKDMPTITIGMCFETFQQSLEEHLHTLDFNLVTQFSAYKELLVKLETGVVDVIVTPQQTKTKGIESVPFSEENIVLIASADIDAQAFQSHVSGADDKAIVEHLMTYKWYGTSSDNEHFKRFWQANFNTVPDFRQNFIVPNFLSIIRSLTFGSGLAIVPDFLCRKEVKEGKVQVLWQGKSPITNQLYFAYRKNTIYKTQIDLLLDIFVKTL